MKEITVNKLVQWYTQPGHPIAFSAPTKIYQYFKRQVPLDFIKNALSTLDVYTLHREYKKPAKSNPTFPYMRRRKRFQSDLISINALAEANRGINFLALIIDCFSRRIYVCPLRRKTGEQTANALKQWLDCIEDDSPTNKQLLTDNGKEYLNRNVKKLLQERNVEHQLTMNINKCAIAERANKSLQIIIYKYLTDKSTLNYLDVLPQLVQTYNNRPHRSLNNLTPNEADDAVNEIQVRGIHIHRHSQLLGKKRRRAKFKEGDIVRIKTYATRPSSQARAYAQQFKGELFRVIKINHRMPIPMFTLLSLDTGEKVEGGFYSNELTKYTGDKFKIEQILDKRGTGSSTEFLVKWQNFGEKWNKWVKADEIETIK